MLHDKGITYVSVGHRTSLIKYHDFVLEAVSEDNWVLHTSAAYLAKLNAEKDCGRCV
jgi:putative ATP-binding cassette transporter